MEIRGRSARGWGWRLRAGRLTEARAALIVVLAFVVSRLWYHARGVRFDTSPIPQFDQLLDPALLQSRLWESIFYLHGQPPLFNLLTGLALKLAPHHPEGILLPVFLGCGLYIGLCLYLILLRLRLPIVVAALLASAMLVSPAFVLHENWYFYPHLNVAWLLGGLAWLAQSRGRPGREMALSAAHWAGLSLTRSLFHPLFFGLVAVLVVCCVARGARRKAGVCFALAALPLLFWCTKNLLLFGFFGTSSWASRNVSHAVETLVGANRVQAEVQLGQLSPAIAIGPFELGTLNVTTFGLTPRTTGIPALDDVQKSTPSAHSVSYNHWSYPESAHFYAHDALRLISDYPVTYAHALVRRAWPLFLSPVNQDWFLAANRAQIAEAADRFDALERSRAWNTALGIGLILALGSAFLSRTPRAQRIVLVVGFLTIAWVGAVGLVGELGENNRFRFKILWLSWALASVGYAEFVRGLVTLADRWRRHWARYRGASMTSTSASPAPRP